MPRSSPYRIALSEEQERELAPPRRRLLGAMARDVVRAKAILLAAQGLSNRVIAERLDVSRDSVSGWRQRFYEEGLDGLQERPRSGRPGSFSPGAGDRGQGAGVRAAGREGRPALTVVKR